MKSESSTRSYGIFFLALSLIISVLILWQSRSTNSSKYSAPKDVTRISAVTASNPLAPDKVATVTYDREPIKAHPHSLTGDAAKAELRKKGQYESLGNAVSAARHAVEKIDPAGPHSRGSEYFAANPKQQLRAWFSTDGVELASGLPAEDNNAEPWRVALRLHGIGRDGSMTTVSAGTATSDGNRVEVRHSRSAITQWFINREEGLEQGFTLHEPPQGVTGEVTVLLNVTGTLRAKTMDQQQSICFIDAKGIEVIQYTGLKAWDANGRSLESRMEIRGSEVALLVADAHAQYPVTIDPLFVSEEAKLNQDSNYSNANFGSSVALKLDTALVGARGDSSPLGSSTGCAYVFVRNGTTWSFQAKLYSSDGVAGDNFGGGAAALSGDTAVVGANGDDTASGANAGSAYVFVRSGTTWTQQAILRASDAIASDFFGTSVSVDGDTTLIGAYGRSSQTGRAYVFVRSGTIWSQQAILTKTDGATYDSFGQTVSLSGDTALIAAYGENTGAAYVFIRSGTTWSQQARLVASDGVAGDNFARSVALDGNTALVGADAGFGLGKAYVFVRNGTTWSQQAKLTANDGANSDGFGMSVALSGTTAVIGAWMDDTFAGANAGSAYVFANSGTVWSQQDKLVSAEGAPGALFGNAVAVSGDTVFVGEYYHNTPSAALAGSASVFLRVGTSWSQQAQLGINDPIGNDRFGYSSVLSGSYALISAAYADSAAGADSGAAYIFVRLGTTWSQQAKLTANNGVANDRFGSSIALDGDTALVGTPSSATSGNVYVFTRSITTWSQQAKLFASDGSSNPGFGSSVAVSSNTALIGASGAAYVFTRSGTVWSQQAKLLSSGTTTGGFGISVALNGDTGIVGANSGINPHTGTASGCAYVFLRSGTTWSPQATLAATDGSASDNFGYAVALNGNTALIGADLCNTPGGVDAGSAYVFARSGTNWAQEAKLTASDAAANDRFGNAVALSGNTALVGAWLDDTIAGTDGGSAYVFARNGTSWTSQAKLVKPVGGSASNSSYPDRFGVSVAVSGNLALVGAYADDVGGIRAGSVYTFLVGDLPAVTTQPVSRTVVPGTQVTFSVTAMGYAPLRYQWRRNGYEIAGATASSLLISVPTQSPFDAVMGTYDVVVSNIGGAVTSAAAVLQVNALSQFNHAFPGLTPDAQGFLLVTLTPSGVGGWRFTGESQWRPSGIPVSALTTGDRSIEFRPVPGYIQPPLETVSIISGGAPTLIERVYYDTPTNGSGGLSVTLKPAALAAASVPEAQRAQWRLLGENDTQWRDTDETLTGLLPGNYLVECKPVEGRTTPPTSPVLVQDFQTAATTLTYFLADALTGTPPSPLPFETVSTDTTKPYAYVGQIRSNAGSSSGFVVKQRVVATAGHVVFDDGTLAAVTGLQWLFQRHRGTYEPKPQIPRGYYIFDGYAAQRALENTPGSSSPQSQNLDVAALYFLEDAGRAGYGGFLASDALDNEFLLSPAQKMLVGYPVDGISATNQGRMHATPASNVQFTRSFGRTFTTPDIRSSGGMSGGPLCVQFESGNYYPAAIYLGGTGQTVVRSIDSQVIDLFNRAAVSGNGGDNNTGGGITHTSFTTVGATSNPGSIRVTILPAAAASTARWGLKSDPPNRLSGSLASGYGAGDYILQLTTISGFQVPPAPTVRINGGQVTQITFTYVAEAPPPAITSSGSVSGTRGQSLNYQIIASQSPSSYSLTGSLPAGLNFNTSTGLLSGIPQEAGVFIVTLGATNSGGTGTKTLAITSRPAIANQSTTVSVGQAMNHPIVSSESGSDLQFAVNDLPPGTSLNELTGLITGTPTQSGVYSSLCTVTKNGASASAIITITVSASALDLWRLANFQTTANTGTAADGEDPDKDGQNNLAEYAAGTNPNSASDVFKVLTTQKTASAFTVTAAGKNGRTYSLQRRADLATGTWTTVVSQGPLTADAPITLIDPSPVGDKAFYRIHVLFP